VAPEVLIVGDAARRSELLERIQGLGYDAAHCSASGLGQRIARGQIPSALVVCTDDVEPQALMEELRGSRRGSGVPVTLYGPLGGRIDDLADVLDLGADHFLEAPVDDDQLAAALDQLVGPGAGATLRAPSGSQGTASQDHEGGTGSTDVVLGQLHRTLDMLEARLREREQAEGEADDLDLAALGFEALPDVGAGEPQPEDSGSSLELSRARMPPRRRDPTERLGVHEPSRGQEPRRAPQARRSSLPIAERGSLDRMEVPRLLWTLHRSGYAGELRLRRGRIEKRLWWRGGDLLFVQSNAAEDRLVDGLLRRGLLTREQFDEASRRVDGDPDRAVSQLVGAGVLKRAELSRVLREHLLRVIDATFSWTDGSYQLDPEGQCQQRVLRGIPVALVLAEGVRHRMDVDQLRTRLAGLAGYPSFRGDAHDARHLAEQLRMSASTGVLIARLDGRRSLAEFVAEPQADELELLALVYTLRTIERLDLVSARSELAAGADPAAIDIRRIQDRLKLSREGDYFVVLGLPRDACPIDVRRAHADLRETFSEGALEPTVVGGMKLEIEELRDLIDEAREVLIDESLRQAYLAHLEDP